MGVRITSGGGLPKAICPACGNPIGTLPEGTQAEQDAAAMQLFEDHVRICLPTRRWAIRFRRRR